MRAALSTLPARINAAKEKEMGEMMGKLKEVGFNLLLMFADEGFCVFLVVAYGFYSTSSLLFLYSLFGSLAKRRGLYEAAWLVD